MLKFMMSLIEGIMPIELSRANYLDTIHHFSKFNSIDAAMENTESLEKKLLKNYRDTTGGIELRSIELFRDDGVDGDMDAYADFDHKKIVFTKIFARDELSNLYKDDGSLDLRELRKFTQTIDHEMVHFIQHEGGAFTHNPTRDNTVVSHDYHKWSDGNHTTAKYDFHTVSTNELQAWSVQIATNAINQLIDEYGDAIYGKFPKFIDMYNHVMKMDGVKENLVLNKINGEKFSLNKKNEKRAIVVMHKWFIKTLQDFYYDGDDRQEEYDAAVDKGEKTRASRMK